MIELSEMGKDFRYIIHKQQCSDSDKCYSSGDHISIYDDMFPFCISRHLHFYDFNGTYNELKKLLLDYTKDLYDNKDDDECDDDILQIIQVLIYILKQAETDDFICIYYE